MSETDFERLNIVLAVRDRELARAIDRNTARIAKFAQQADKRLGVTAQKFDRVSVSAARGAVGLSRFANMSGSSRFVFQNTAAQIGDIAVQLESGTAASRVMAQQLPQLLGGFGALGGALGFLGPLLGTVAAVGVPLAAMFLMNSDRSREAAAEVRTFAERLSEAEAAISRAQSAASLASAEGLDQLQARYGEITEKVRGLADALYQIEVRAAKAAVGNVLEGALGEGFQAEIDRVFGTVGAALVAAGSDQAAAEAEQIRQLIRDVQAEILAIHNAGLQIPIGLAEQLNELNQELAAVEGRVGDIGSLASDLVASPETLERLSDLQAGLEAARQAGDFAGVADGLSDIRAILAEIGVDIDQAVIDGLVQAEDQARQMAAELGQGEVAAEGLAGAAGQIAGGLAPAVAEAQRLADWLNIGLSLALRLARLGPQGVPSDTPQGGRGGDPRDMGGSIDDWRYREADAFLADWRPPPPIRGGRGGGGGGGGGRGGGSSRAPDELRQYEKLQEQLNDAIKEGDFRALDYQATLEDLRAQYQAGALSTEEFGKSVSAVGEVFREHQRMIRTVADSFEDAAVEILTLSGTVSDAIAGLLRQLGNLAAKAAVSGIFDGIGVALAPIFTPGAAPSLEGGGATPRGARVGGVDGRGGFWAVLHPNETVEDHERPDLARRPSFEGGGATPRGARVGGVDGRGGFWAVLHPNETVEDHERPDLARRPSFEGGGYTGPGAAPLRAAAGGAAMRLDPGSGLMATAPGAADRGQITLNFQPQIDARGADQAALARLETRLERMAQDFDGRVIETVSRAQRRRALP